MTPPANPPPHRPDLILIIGLGNEYRGDDGLGPEVAKKIREMSLPGLTIQEVNGDLAGLLLRWQGAAAVFLVDALSSGTAPGTIFRFEAHAAPLPVRTFAPASSHALGLVEALELARTLGQMPPRVIVYGVEGQNFAAGQGLSPAVAQALPKVVNSILAEIDRR